MLSSAPDSRKKLGIESRASKVFYLAGPTGVGKTALALELAGKLDAEIVGADAFQIYEGMPILTAQPSEEEQRRIPHHLVGCIRVSEAFDAQRYVETVRPILEEILGRGRVALVVGGTGLYFRALIDGFAPTPPVDPGLRAELEQMELLDLADRLRRVDPAAPGQIDLRNKRRVTRAIEIVETSGQPLASFRSTPRADVPGLLLVRERENLRERIEHNVRTMFERGVIEEVRALGEGVGITAARAIGFREIQALVRGEMTRAECETAIVLATRQYAKRQLTWFRNQTKFSALDLTHPQYPSEGVENALRVFDSK